MYWGKYCNIGESIWEKYCSIGDVAATTMSLSTRAPRHTIPWTIVMDATESTTLLDAIKKLKASGAKKWKWAKTPGNGRTYAVFQCNAHEGCTHLRMAAKCDEKFIIKETGEHTEVVKLKKRSNSALTFAEEDAVRGAITGGTRPAALLVTMTDKKAEELRSEGKAPLDHKDQDGGLEGVCMPFHGPDTVQYTRYGWIVAYLQRIPTVSGLYSSDTLDTVGWLRICNVFRLYLSCILQIHTIRLDGCVSATYSNRI